MTDTSKVKHGSPDGELNHGDLSGAPALEEDPEEESSPPQEGGPDLLGKLAELVRELHEEIQDLRGEVQALRRKEVPDGPSRLLPREEAAETLGISVRTLDDMEELGEIQAVRIRGRVLYAPETLQAYIRRQARDGQS